MSLHRRLIATLLVLAAAGMVVLAAVTYASQRDFELDRIDDQTRAALPAVGRELRDAGSTLPGFGGPRPRGGGGPRGVGSGGPPPPALPPPSAVGPGRDGDGRGPGAAANLPPGTFGQLREADGSVVGSVVLGYGEETPAAPALPEQLTAGELQTVDATDGSTRFRVRSSGGPGDAQVVVAIPLDAVDETLDRLLLVEALVIAAVLLLLAVAASVLVRLGLRPLELMGETATSIAAGDLDRRIEETDPRTEVGRLGLALNGMLARLERAFAERESSERRLRRFLSDASHELRTPLASIRGYAELYRMGAAASEDDVERSMGRIEDEAARMGVLVEDLLALARLDEQREPVREPVDVSALVEDAAADARATDPSREIVDRADGAAVVTGDADQLRQVLANLVRNALVHTPAGTRVEVSSSRVDGRVVLAVRDHGEGLPTDDPDALFERFWRAEAGRVRGRAGAGLGLAIVAKVAADHGGRVRAANAEGGGARFTVELPPA